MATRREDRDDDALWRLFRAIASGKDDEARRLLADDPGLAVQSARNGATRRDARAFYIASINHYLVAGDTALHCAAAAYQLTLIRELLRARASTSARNRHGAEPLHYAAAGLPGSKAWAPERQAEVVTCLIEAGANPNAFDKRGVAPLHLAVRTRCAAAVRALLTHGADPRQRNGNGSTPLDLATRNTGRGGSGSGEAKAEQKAILELLQWA